MDPRILVLGLGGQQHCHGSATRLFHLRAILPSAVRKHPSLFSRNLEGSNAWPPCAALLCRAAARAQGCRSSLCCRLCPGLAGTVLAGPGGFGLPGAEAARWFQSSLGPMAECRDLVVSLGKQKREKTRAEPVPF